MGIGGQSNVPAALPPEEPQYPIYGWVGPTADLDENEENLLPQCGSNPEPPRL
jgi:hypothetical protein